MHFSEDTPAGNYIITAYSDNSITVNAREISSSVYLSPTTLIESVPILRCDQLTIPSLQFIFELKPEVLLLGTGPKLQFPSPRIIASLAQEQIGFEAMDHAAACRTYAVLATEQRNVGALFLIDK